MSEHHLYVVISEKPTPGSASLKTNLALLPRNSGKILDYLDLTLLLRFLCWNSSDHITPHYWAVSKSTQHSVCLHRIIQHKWLLCFVQPTGKHKTENLTEFWNISMKHEKSWAAQKTTLQNASRVDGPQDHLDINKLAWAPLSVALHFHHGKKWY